MVLLAVFFSMPEYSRSVSWGRVCAWSSSHSPLAPVGGPEWMCWVSQNTHPPVAGSSGFPPVKGLRVGHDLEKTSLFGCSVILFPPEHCSGYTYLCTSYLWCHHLDIFSVYVRVNRKWRHWFSDLEEPACTEGRTLESLLRPTCLPSSTDGEVTVSQVRFNLGVSNC